MQRKTITAIARTIVSLVLSVSLAACSTTAHKNSLPDVTVSGAIISKTLVLTLRGATPEITVGAIDVTIEMPDGVSVKAQNNGLIESDVITTPPTSTRPFLSGKYSAKSLRVALISPTGIKDGEVMQIKVNLADGDVLRAESFRVTSLQVIDLKGNNVNGTSIDCAVW
jgi:hypothetical protein